MWKRYLAALLALTAFTAQPASGEWQAMEITRDGVPQKFALVENAEGYRLEIHKDPEQQVHGTFILRPGFDEFSEHRCPTFKADRRAPVNLAESGKPCKSAGDRAEFNLGRVEDKRIQSPLLVQLMNGSRLELIFPLHNVGYQTTSFPLRGSKQALLEVLGRGVKVRSQ